MPASVNPGFDTPPESERRDRAAEQETGSMGRKDDAIEEERARQALRDLGDRATESDRARLRDAKRAYDKSSGKGKDGKK